MNSITKKIQNRLYNTKLILNGIYFTFIQKYYRIGDLKFSIPLDKTTYSFRGRFPLGLYEKEEIAHLKKHLPSDATVLELGACLGVVSCLTNSLLSNKKNHVVVEANPNLIDNIKLNKQQNGCQFSIENCMVSSNKVNDFYIHHLIVGGSAQRATNKKIQIPGKTVNDIEKEYNLEFDVLIMDIEGGELNFLRENQSFLKNLNYVFIEIHAFANILTQEQSDECEKLLSSSGFSKILTDQYFQIWKR